MNLSVDGKDLLILHMIYQGNPSMHELRHAIQCRSVGTVAARLDRMQDMGLVMRLKVRQARARRITKEGLDILKAKGLVNVNETLPVYPGVGSPT